MPAVTPILWKYRSNKEGLSPIYVRISDESGSRYRSLKIYVKPGHWNDRSGRVTSRHANADQINRVIGEAVKAAEDEVYRRRADGQPVAAIDVKRAMEAADPGARPGRDDFFAFADDFVAGYLTRDQVWAHARYKSVINKLRRYTGEPFAFEDLTPTFLRRYEDHLAGEHKNGVNTVATNLNAIRTVVRRAVAEGRMDHGANPFSSHRIKHARTVRIRLTLAEVQKIERVELDPESRQGLARNTFLFQFYAGGARFSDAAFLQWRSVQDGQISYIASKTKKATALPLVAQAAAIVDLYRPTTTPDPDGLVFPLLAGYDLSTASLRKRAVQSRTTRVNAALKEIAKLAGIDKNLSTHIARHSFAEHCRVSGMSIYDISQLIRHSSLAQTEQYLDGFNTGGLGDRLHTIFPLPTLAPNDHADSEPDS